MEARATVGDALSLRWRLVVEAVTRPYRVTIPMVALVFLVPGYLVIANVARGRSHWNEPSIGLDDWLTLQPEWALVYGALYAFLIVLPVFVVHQQEHIRRTVLAYLTVWLSAYVCFLLYPTVAPRPNEVAGDGFGVWGLRILYDADPPYNCFPSIHVGHSFVSAFACAMVHRRLGLVTIICATLVALSTLLTKQHYVLDAAAGFLLAGIGYLVFLRGYDCRHISPRERRVAPLLALATIGAIAIVVGGFWVAYRIGATV